VSLHESDLLLPALLLSHHPITPSLPALTSDPRNRNEEHLPSLLRRRRRRRQQRTAQAAASLRRPAVRHGPVRVLRLLWVYPFLGVLLRCASHVLVHAPVPAMHWRMRTHVHDLDDLRYLPRYAYPPLLCAARAIHAHHTRYTRQCRNNNRHTPPVCRLLIPCLLIRCPMRHSRCKLCMRGKFDSVRARSQVRCRRSGTREY
jgi:hypothetical protein